MFLSCALAVLFLLASAYAAKMRRRAARGERAAAAALERETAVVEAARVLAAASRESTQSVLRALDAAVRLFEPALDAVLVFEKTGDELACVFASGRRTEYFAGARLRLDGASLPARAALRGHRLELPQGDAVIPTDRSALAVPFAVAGSQGGVAYLASPAAEIRRSDLLVATVTQAAPPYALAAEREADRARATYDALTGLYTARAFRDRLRDDLRVAAIQGGDGLALWFVDTDRFKDVNDRFGHARGDAVLARVASVLCEHLTAGVDVAARNGGDEFCAILYATRKIPAIERAQRFCDAMRECDFGVQVAITASVGVASFPSDARDASDLLEAADAAMYHSKRSGRDRVSYAAAGGGFSVYK